MKKRPHVIATEMVSRWHPDSYADIISDTILTECLKQDRDSHVACETLVKGSTIVLAGEITTKADIDYEQVARSVAKKMNYPVEEVVNLISLQSSEINNAVVRDGNRNNQGAGDQGIMFGYAVNDEEHDYLPYGLWLSNKVIEAIEEDVTNNRNTILKGDAKTQIVDTDGSITEILISVCHREGLIIEEVRDYIHGLLERKGILSMDGISNDVKLIINPSGTWTIGGPTADCGLTGRKIVCNAYGGYAPVGGGCWSGKDGTKVDRSASYMARVIAVDTVRDYGFEDCLVQLSYGIGLSEPRSVSVIGKKKNIFGKLKEYDVSEEVRSKYDLTPSGIIKYLNLDTMNYSKIAGGCHTKYFI